MGRILRLTERIELADIRSLRGGDLIEFPEGGNFELVFHCDDEGLQTVGMQTNGSSYMRTVEIQGWNKEKRKFMGFEVYDELNANGCGSDYINKLMEEALKEAA